MLIQSWSKELTKPEYGIKMQRLYQVKAPPVMSPFGGAWGFIEPGAYSAPHVHHEHETFIITQGSGRMEIDGQTSEVGRGDTIYIPPNCNHVLYNTGIEQLVFITIWWE